MDAMQESHDAEFVSLHVRVTNRAAFSLYSSVLGFEIHDVEKQYYADKEDAYDMRKVFKKNPVKKVGGRAFVPKNKRGLDTGADMSELDGAQDSALTDEKMAAEADDADGEGGDGDGEQGFDTYAEDKDAGGSAKFDPASRVEEKAGGAGA